MKKAMKIILAMAMVLLMSGGVMAQECFNTQGSCLIPSVRGYASSSYGENTKIFLTNISNTSVQCKVNLFDHQGNDFSSYADVYTVAADGVAWQVLGTSNNAFEIPAHSTRLVQLAPSSGAPKIIGYGDVKWKSNDPMLRKALVGILQHYYSERSSQVSTAFGGELFLNNGQPF